VKVFRNMSNQDLIGEVAKNLGKNEKNISGFQTMKLQGKLLRAIMKQGYRVPTPIQRKVIPEALSGKDIVAMARTGSGKSVKLSNFAFFLF
jgi:ATP-dependent RNA helicase DDX54/DBP10